MMSRIELAVKDRLKGFSIVRSEIDDSLKNHRIVMKADGLDCGSMPYGKYARLLERQQKKAAKAILKAAEATGTVCVLLKKKIGVPQMEYRPTEFPGAHMVAILQKRDFSMYTDEENGKVPCPSCGKFADIVDDAIGYCRRCGLSINDHWNIEAVRTHSNIFLTRVGAQRTTEATNGIL